MALFWEDIQALCGRQDSQVSLISDFLALTRKAKQRSSQGALASGALATLFRSGMDPGSGLCPWEFSTGGLEPGGHPRQGAWMLKLAYAHAQCSPPHLPGSAAPLGLLDEAGPRPRGHLPGASAALQCHGRGGLKGGNHLTPHSPAVLRNSGLGGKQSSQVSPILCIPGQAQHVFCNLTRSRSAIPGYPASEGGNNRVGRCRQKVCPPKVPTSDPAHPTPQPRPPRRPGRQSRGRCICSSLSLAPRTAGIYRDLQPGWARHACSQQAIFLRPAASWAAHLAQNREGRLSPTTSGPAPGGYTQVSLISGFPGTASEGKTKQAFQWDLASGERATLFRSGLDPGSPVCAPEVLACGQVYPYTAQTRMDPREPDAQSARYVPALFTPEHLRRWEQVSSIACDSSCLYVPLLCIWLSCTHFFRNVLHGTPSRKTSMTFKIGLGFVII